MKIKNVINYEGIYAVSDDGRVFNLQRGIEMKQHITGGYMYVKLRSNGEYINERVHRLVYESFKGRIIPNLVIDHIDGDRLNNNLTNLRQITTRENTTYGWRNHKTSGLPTGVREFKQSGIFGAEISIEGERYYLGSSHSAEEASEAYQQALKRWTGEGIKPIKRDRTTKLCKTCGQTKSITEFYNIKGHGLSWYCKECNRADARRRRELKKSEQQNGLTVSSAEAHQNRPDYEIV